MDPTKETPQEALVITIGGEQLSLNNFTPLTMGDRKRLSAEMSVDFRKAESFTPEEDIKFALYLLRRVRPQTTELEVEALTINDGQSVMVAQGRANQRTRPTSPPSTP